MNSNICDCYHIEYGKPVCWGTKEIDECSCGGQMSRCDFYPEKRNRPKHERRVLNLFTHTDLDGVGCAVVAQLYAQSGFDSITVKFCDYGNINKEVNDFLDYVGLAEKMDAQPAGYREILITDISVDLNTALRLDEFVEQRKDIKLVMLDHHQLSDEIKKLSWVHVDDSHNECGTSLLYDYVNQYRGFLWGGEAIRSFVNDVRMYDTWQFDKNDETNAENFNILLSLLGKEEFEMTMTSLIRSAPHEPIIITNNSMFYPFVDCDRKNRKQYCAMRNKSKKIIEYKGYKVAVVFAERYISKVGDYILTTNPDIDVCAIVNLPSSVSLRTQREDINVGLDIAKPLGGGGHPQAAGYQLCELPDELVKEIIRFDEQVYKS